MTKCTHCDATVLTSTLAVGVENMTITDEMVETAWSAIVGRDIAKTCFNASIIRADLKTGLTAALAAAPASWRSGATPAVGGLEAMAEIVHNARWPADRQMTITPFADEDRNGREYCFRIARAVLAAQPAPPLRGREWQRISTAPKDGSAIEVRYVSDDPRRVRWTQSASGTGWHLTDAFSGTIIKFEPTEWRSASPPEQPETEREAIIKECELAARGAVYKKICEGNNWSMDSEYGRGRHAAADAVRALSDQETT